MISYLCKVAGVSRSGYYKYFSSESKDLRKSREDIESEKYGEGETLARHEKILTSLASTRNLTIGKIYREVVSVCHSLWRMIVCSKIGYDFSFSFTNK